MDKIQVVGTYRDGDTGKFGVWVSASVKVGGRRVPIDLRGDAHFTDSYECDFRARKIMEDLSPYGNPDMELLTWDDQIDHEGEEDSDG